MIGKPSRHPLWMSGAEDPGETQTLTLLGGSLPRGFCLAPPTRARNRTDPISKPKDAEGSACLPPVAPTRPQAPEDPPGQLQPGAPAPQLATPARRALSHRIGPGREGRRGDPPRWEPGRPSLTPSFGRGVPAHNIRPASRLRRPSGVKLSAHCARAPAGARAPPGGALRHLRRLPPGCSRPMPRGNAQLRDRPTPGLRRRRS